MGFQSQAGQVGFKTQATPGVYADPATTGVFVRTRSGGLATNRELMIPDPEIGGVRDVPDATLGPVSWSGEYDFYARSRAVALFLKAVLGDASSAVAGTGPTQVGTHTIVPATTLPWVSIEDNVGGTLETFQYIDAKANTFHLEVDATGYLMGTVGWIAKRQSAGNTKTPSPGTAWDSNPLMVGTNVAVTYNGVTLPAKSFNLDINNNMEDDDFRLGSFFLGDVTEKRREITAGLTIRPQDAALWRQASYGTPAATSPGGLTTKQALVVTAETYEVVGSSTSKHSVSLTFPYAVVQPFSIEPSGDDVIEFDIELQALAPVPGTPIVTAVVVNQDAVVA